MGSFCDTVAPCAASGCADTMLAAPPDSLRWHRLCQAGASTSRLLRFRAGVPVLLCSSLVFWPLICHGVVPVLHAAGRRTVRSVGPALTTNIASTSMLSYSMIQLAWLSDQSYMISYQTCANTLKALMVLMWFNLMNHHPSSGPGPHLIIHHQVITFIRGTRPQTPPNLRPR